jgi:hypothetical protein
MDDVPNSYDLSRILVRRKTTPTSDRAQLAALVSPGALEAKLWRGTTIKQMGGGK